MTRIIPKALDIEIIILSPAAGSSGVSTGQVSPDCKISANGTLNDNVTKSLKSISGTLNNGSPVIGTVASDGRHWNIDGLGPAFNGDGNVLKVTGTYTDYSTSTPCQRTFTGFGGGSGCVPPSGVVGGGMLRTSHQILPRFYRVALDSRALNLFESGSDLLLGGLLHRTSVYLAYDPIQSLPEAPVWRDINLPSPAGSWSLRVDSSGCCATARLVLTRLTESHVLPPLVWVSDDWSPRGPNAMSCTQVSPAGSPLHIWVEPA